VNAVNICFLGSSYIGAVYSAYRGKVESGEKAWSIDFYGHSNGGFSNVDIINGHISNVRFKSNESRPVNAYDALVIYADLPSPHDVLKATASASQAGCSQQVVGQVASDLIRSSNAFRLAQAFRSQTGKPVLMLSGNVVSVTNTKMDDLRLFEILDLFYANLDEHIYVPFPRHMFDHVNRPLKEFYKDSILLTGDRAGADAAGHDNHHMNERGGREILTAVEQCLEQLFVCRTQAA